VSSDPLLALCVCLCVFSSGIGSDRGRNGLGCGNAKEFKTLEAMCWRRKRGYFSCGYNTKDIDTIPRLYKQLLHH